MDLEFFDEAMNAIGIKPTYIGFDKPEKSVNEVLTTCVKCGHNKKEHYRNRGACKHKELCLCGRYVGR